MSKGVRNIFLTLIGTVVLIAAISIFAEFINISLNGVMLQQRTKLSCEKALTLFCQESYKARTSASGAKYGGSLAVDNVRSADGEEYISGDFYGSESVEEIYARLYANGTDFGTWVDGGTIANRFDASEVMNGTDLYWTNIDLLAKYFADPSEKTMPKIENYYSPGGDWDAAFEAYTEDMDIYTDWVIGKNFADTYTTPINFGVPYIDVETATHMFRWNLAQNLSGCRPEAIRRDDSGELCVEIDGFRVYADRATLEIEYRVYDMNDPSDRNEFLKLTNIYAKDPDTGEWNLAFAEDANVVQSLLGTDTDERMYICILGVSYKVPVSYIGVSPIRHVFEFFWNYEVNGAVESGKVAGYSEATTGDGITARDKRFWNTAASDMGGGGFENEWPEGTLPIGKKLVFYLVR